MSSASKPMLHAVTTKWLEKSISDMYEVLMPTHSGTSSEERWVASLGSELMRRTETVQTT